VTVKQRLVFYCHGYDPEADSRYRRLFVTAFSQLSRRFDIKRSVGPVVRDEGVPADRWTVAAAGRDWQTETIYEVLRWDDLVKRDAGRSWAVRLPLLAGAMAEALRSGVLRRLFRLNRPFALFVIYPWAMLAGCVAGGLLLGYGAASLVSLARPLGPAACWGIAAVVALGFLRAARTRLVRAHVYHLLDGWIFTWRQATGRDAAFGTRQDRFVRHVVDRVRASDADEVLIVGHSTGSTIACELVARALALDPGFATRGPSVALLTIGSCLPVVAFVRTARRLRCDIARLATTEALLWVEYQAPQDALNAFGFDPVRDLELDVGGAAAINPRLRSARFKETLLPANYRRMRYNFFRMHFQFLAANDVPGEYDYLMIACGPVSLAERIADPQRAIATAYGRSAPTPEATAVAAAADAA